MPALDLLVGFESAARHLSFTKAGEELFLTQSAVSRQIKELEDQLGVALFQRRHRALALTAAGHQFYAAAAQALSTMRTATDRLRAQAGKKALSVTTTHSFAALWLIPRLAGFTRDHPGVDVRIAADTKVQDLERDGLDLALRHGPASLAGPNAARLFGEKVFRLQSQAAQEETSLEKPSRPEDPMCCCNTTIPTAAIPGCTGRPGSRSSASPTSSPRARFPSRVTSRSSPPRSPVTALPWAEAPWSRT
jgi:DNA-binding transcriptional LysR family regulator